MPAVHSQDLLSSNVSELISLAAGAAGSAWRRNRFTDLIAGAESAGLDRDPEVQALLACVGEHTAHLEELWQKQQVRE